MCMCVCARVRTLAVCVYVSRCVGMCVRKSTQLRGEGTLDEEGRNPPRPLRHDMEGVDKAHTPHTHPMHDTLCVCVACTHVCAGLHPLLGGLSP